VAYSFEDEASHIGSGSPKPYLPTFGHYSLHDLHVRFGVGKAMLIILVYQFGKYYVSIPR
jgi:hypothetical protein